ncbi:MAG: CDP-glycerol glycerophosphotransferase family protein [Oscillospiraceae bacterium]|nr:CDP-glycerol glycerophosphotransferase family protein [Oscillospiraceae bacterium]
MRKIIFRWNQIKFIPWFLLFKFIGIFIKKKHWVIFERGVDARDNGYFFYKYMKENHTEQKIYYIIDKHSADYHKVAEDAIAYGSIKSCWVIATGEKLISSHYGTGIPYINKKTFEFCGLNKNYYFLQHGIIKDKLTKLFGDAISVRLFVCGAEPEYNYVKENFGHPEGVVQYTGLARYDSLHDFCAKDQILIMPTWRYTLQDRTDIIDSVYFQQWQEILLNKRLEAFLEKNNMQLVFYPHFEIQKYIHNFKTESEYIKIADFANYDVQTLLKESKLLVTDYSSVYFDFAYMKKPVIYFQFDRDEFFASHYQKGYFDYDTMGFGDVCFDVENVVDSIIACVQNNFIPKECYASRMGKFFPLNDTKNCERIYKSIIEL